MLDRVQDLIARSGGRSTPPDVVVSYQSSRRPRVQIFADGDWCAAVVLSWSQIGGRWQADVEVASRLGPAQLSVPMDAVRRA